MFPFEQLSLELLVAFAFGLMVLGPKDLPIVMRRIGQFIGKMRGMAAEFRASFDELARQSELDELRKEVEALRNARPMDFVTKTVGADDMMHEINADLAAANAAFTAKAATEAAASAPASTAPPHEPTPPAPEPEPGPKAAAE